MLKRHHKVFSRNKKNVFCWKKQDVPRENQWVLIRESETISQCQLSSTHVNNENWTENHVKLDRTMYQSTSVVWHAYPELRLCNLKAKLKRKWMQQMVVLETDNQLFFANQTYLTIFSILAKPFEQFPMAKCYLQWDLIQQSLVYQYSETCDS